MNPEPEPEASDKAEPVGFVPGSWLMLELLLLFAAPVDISDAHEPTIEEPAT